MSERKPQNYANHTRLDPAFHYFLAPVLLITLIGTIVHLVAHPRLSSIWHVVLALALVVLAVKCRTYALKAQDRVIRLEEQLRLAMLLPEAQRAHIGDLSVKQLVALRFASDAELPELAERAWRENLEPKQIKQAIQIWRPDHYRV
ncbi:MAG TPA: DUF6526 family protein [Acidobacteriaceae bacterium]|nr:DUF6526 family protein [Acidobacteriaceae bacterium]